MQSLYYYLPAAVFAVLFWRASVATSVGSLRSAKGNRLAQLTIGLYLLSASLVGFIDPEVWYPFLDPGSFRPEYFALYAIFITVFLFPSYSLRPLRRTTDVTSHPVFGPLMTAMAMCAWFSLLYQLPYALTGLSIGAADLRLQMNTEGRSLLPDSMFTTLAVGISSFYMFYIAFFLISVAQKRHFFLKLSLLVGVISYLVSGLTFTTRDVFVFVLFGFLFNYFLLNYTFSSQQKRSIRTALITFGVICIVSIIGFTLQRFVNDSRSEFLYGTVGYIAQQPYVFAATIDGLHELYFGDLRFPVFKTIATFQEVQPPLRIQTFERMFGTFVRDLYAEGGWLFLTIFCFAFTSFFLSEFTRSERLSGFRLLICQLFYFQFISTGVFYFVLGSRPGNLYTIVLIAAYFFFRFTESPARIRQTRSFRLDR